MKPSTNAENRLILCTKKKKKKKTDQRIIKPSPRRSMPDDQRGVLDRGDREGNGALRIRAHPAPPLAPFLALSLALVLPSERVLFATMCKYATHNNKQLRVYVSFPPLPEGGYYYVYPKPAVDARQVAPTQNIAPVIYKTSQMNHPRERERAVRDGADQGAKAPDCHYACHSSPIPLNYRAMGPAER